MNSLIIPPSPTWYESTVFVCAPDNTVIYGSRSDLVVIKPKSPSQPADVKIIVRAHQDKIVSLAVSPAWEKKKLVASLASDKTVKLWNMEECVFQLSHRAHTANSTEVVGVTFAGNDRIVSVSADGETVVWRFGPNELVVLKDLFGTKPKVTCLSVCPHLNWLVAFGMNNGLVIVTDLRKNGRVLYRLRRHDEAIVSFSWCPIHCNILQKQEDATVLATASSEQETNPADASAETTKKDETEHDLINLNTPPHKSENAGEKPGSVETKDETKTHLDNTVKIKKSNPWGNLKPANEKKLNVSRPIPQHFDVSSDCFADEDSSFFEVEPKIGQLVQLESDPEDKKPVVKEESVQDDFLAACARLKEQILQNIQLCDDSTSKEPDTSLVQSLETVSVQLAKVDLGIDEVKSESPEKNEFGHSSAVEIVKDKEEDKPDCEGVLEENSAEPSSADATSMKVDKTESTCSKSDTKEVLLASSTKGGNVICIWSVGKRGRLQAELHLPGRSQGHKKRGSSNCWIALLWITPTLLLSSSRQGELLSWDLRRIKGKGHDLKPSLIHNDHTSQLFCIAAPIEYNKEEAVEENWRKEVDLRVWTTGQDRYILNTNLGSSREVFISYPTIGGPIQCMAQSPLDPNRVAIGIGDGSARVWDLSKPHLQCITMTRLWQKMSSRILALAWHPSKEAILAYGTYEGRIGVADTLNLSKSPVLMSMYFNKGIYQLQWGPLKDQPNVGLYACSEGKVVVYNSEKPIEDPYVIPSPEGEQITQFTWNQDYSILVLGAKSGTIFFYTADIKPLHTTYYQQKSVQCLVWHPEAFVEGSSYFAWLASSTSDKNFVIYNCSCLINSDGGGDKEVSVVADLLGHSNSVRCLCWSPHEGNKLVSVGEDFVAQVWDVSTKTIIGTYQGHSTDGILAVVWSPLDPDFIISGGRDNTLRVWRVSECPPIDLTVLETISKTKKKITKSDKSEENLTQLVQTSSKTKRILDSVSRLDNGGAVSFLDDCRRLFETDHGAANATPYKVDALDIFKSRDDVLKFLDYEEGKHLKSGKRLQAHHISLWKGNIAETIKQAITDGTVTPFLISLAPMVSPKLWQEACEVYSNRLKESSKADPSEVAAYYLACHKVEEAIEVLATGGFFREALALAKSRLGEEDALVTSILERWASSSLFEGNFEIAAQCYIALGKLEDAAKLLFRRSDEVTLKLALEIAERVNNEELYKAVLVRYNTFKDVNKEETVEATAAESEEVVDNDGSTREEEH